MVEIAHSCGYRPRHAWSRPPRVGKVSLGKVSPKEAEHVSILIYAVTNLTKPQPPMGAPGGVDGVRACLGCGCDISGRHGCAIRCVQCADAAKAELWRRAARERYQRAHPPTPRSCLDCGVDISGRARQARRCAPCAVAQAARKSNQRRVGTPEWNEYYHAYRATPEGHTRHKEAMQRYRKTPAGKESASRGFHKRRARLRGQDGLELTQGLQTRLYAAQRGRCQACGLRFTKKRPPHLDHMDPLARGGRNEDANVQLLCAPCNQSKGARTHVEFALSRGRLL